MTDRTKELRAVAMVKTLDSLTVIFIPNILYRMKLYSFCFALFAASISHATNGAEKIEKNCFIRPCELRADFDGDKKQDVATLVRSSSGKKGIQVRFSTGKLAIIGAGESFGNGGDDFSWMDKWGLHKGVIGQGATDESPPKAKGVGVDVEKTDSASAVLYWDGSRFQWYQQGD